ncbi:MAG: universal stress protein [Chitinophaga sp.]|uniref:universal stress protein n=1 Tax=Chitinophaga sp. TaxID=1869181 RepID=UPI001B15804C|nr:universal stress protein [Chitinophaga sp.]MBO9729685.1 universal stress protein [Chitinophaga sp.]
MEKILLVMCGAAPTKNALNFACYLSDITRSRLTGIFFDNENYVSDPLLTEENEMLYSEGVIPAQSLKAEGITTHMRTFEETCELKGIQASVKYLESNVPEDIIAESSFADLIIADAAISCLPGTQEAPSPLLQQLMANAQCPVIIAPAAFTRINEVVFCYDGTPSSVFAMKQLSYLLPELGDAKATIVQVNNEDIPTAERKRIITWLSRHFESSDIVTLKGKSEPALFDYLLKKQDTLVVMGAYGRSIVSRLFKRSHADLLIKTLAYPLFITHY